MIDIVLYSLIALAGSLGLAGGLLAIYRLTPRTPASEDAIAAHRRLDDMEVVFESFRAQYELENTRSLAKLGKLRRALARERGEEEEEVIDVIPTVPVHPEVRQSKAELRARWNAKNGGTP